MQLMAITLRVAVIQVRKIAVMRIKYAFGMLDWAPVLFGAARDLACVSDETVRIAAIEAVHGLDPVEIGEPMVIEDDVIAMPYARDAVYAKANMLVKRHPEIQQRQGQKERINDRGHEHMRERRLAQKQHDALPELAMPRDHGPFESEDSPTQSSLSNGP